METLQTVLRSPRWSLGELASLGEFEPDWVLLFGSTSWFSDPTLANTFDELLPNAVKIGCSTAGEICADQVHDNTCVITGVKFAHTRVRAASTPLASMADSGAAGTRLASELLATDLSAVFVLGTGVNINGSALVMGLRAGLPANVKISGGLAADGGAFKRTWTLGPEGPADDRIVALGFYGDRLRLSYGSFGGWTPFGPARKVTRSVDNVLYELDGERALDIYKRYLGDYAKGLPASGLLFPFEMLSAEHAKQGIFRSILDVNEADGSLTLAGDIDPQGYLKLSHSSTERLIDGAESAARTLFATHDEATVGGLAILVSCVGRKLVMGDRVDEEVEAVAGVLGRHNTLTGFYSNGEISGADIKSECRLHNETMTISWLSEMAKGAEGADGLQATAVTGH